MVNNMSDPVTNAEVEDVLSSIRRLVSEDRRPINRAKSEAQFEDKLVLTPSLRVSNDAPLVDAYKKQTQDIAPTEWDDRAIGNAVETKAVETKAVEAKAGDDTLDDYAWTQTQIFLNGRTQQMKSRQMMRMPVVISKQ